IPNYGRQIPLDEWYQRINQILTLPSIMSAAFDNLLQADILKTVNIQNKSHSDSSGIFRTELDSIIKSQLALQKQHDFSNYLRVPDKYMPERPPDG
ncbi:5559_t:CDS:2, partial [Cetraspora pellucida]